MVENIALIKEYHEHLDTPKAQQIAKEYLSKIDLESIAIKRQNSCSPLEIFYVMLIRSLMSSKKNLFIITPLFLIEELESISDIIENIKTLNNIDKKITILDTFSNEVYYKVCKCNITR